MACTAAAEAAERFMVSCSAMHKGSVGENMECWEIVVGVDAPLLERTEALSPVVCKPKGMLDRVPVNRMCCLAKCCHSAGMRVFLRYRSSAVEETLISTASRISSYLSTCSFSMSMLVCVAKLCCITTYIDTTSIHKKVIVRALLIIVYML